jgi:D-tyrosyl-tRNA(Tyr) deacylase
MRAVVQRVAEASVTIDGQSSGRVGRGLLVLVGVEQGDGRSDAEWLAAKIAGLRIFADAEGKMNRSVTEIGAELLVVSQFTLLADTCFPLWRPRPAGRRSGACLRPTCRWPSSTTGR